MENRPASETFPLVSVIVPVCNEAERVRICIESLLAQTYPPERREILIVDNASTDDTREVIGKYPVKLLQETGIRSSYAARNRGIRDARGEVLAFTDADCVAAPDWIERGVSRLLQTPGCGLVAGSIKFFYSREGRPNPVELYDSMVTFHQKEDVEERRFGSTANIFTFRSVLEDVGYFDAGLKSGGDNEWGRRVYSRGYTQIFAEDASVLHPARTSLGQICRRTVRLVGGQHDQHFKGANAVVLLRDLLRSLRNMAALSIGIFLGMFPDKKIKGAKAKTQFIAISCIVEVVRMFERVRLWMGSGSRQ